MLASQNIRPCNFTTALFCKNQIPCITQTTCIKNNNNNNPISPLRNYSSSEIKKWTVTQEWFFLVVPLSPHLYKCNKVLAGGLKHYCLIHTQKKPNKIKQEIKTHPHPTIWERQQRSLNNGKSWF